MERRTVGDAHVTALFDTEGSFFSTLEDAFPDASPAARDAARDLDPGACPTPNTWWLTFRCFVIEIGSAVILVDTGGGSGTPMRPPWVPQSARHLAQALGEDLDIPRDAVTHVVLTHLHADHLAGSVTPEGQPAFPNARYAVQEREVQSLREVEDETTGLRLVRTLEATGQLEVAHGFTPMMTGAVSLTLVPTPGHSVGHQSVVLDDLASQVVLAGDAFVHALQVVAPDTTYSFEFDPDEAAATRRGLLRQMRSRPSWLGTAHLCTPFLAISPGEVE